MSVKDCPPRVRKFIEERMGKEWPASNDARISLSELLGCMRKSWYNRRKPLPVEFKGKARMFHGIVFDDLYTHLYPRNQVRVTHRISDRELTISGRLDFIDDDGAVADWKTVDGMYYTKKKGAREDHISQVLFYCWCEAIPKGRLYYQSMGDFIKIDINPTPDQLMANLQHLEELAKQFHHFLITDAPPPRKEKKDWECEYGDGDDVSRCQYYDRCYKGGEKNGATQPVLEGWGEKDSNAV